MDTFHNNDVRDLAFATVEMAHNVREAALKLAPVDLVDKLEAERRLGLDGYNTPAVRIHFPRSSGEPPRERWVDLKSGLADLQNPNGLDAAFYAEQRREFEDARRQRRMDRKLEHDRKEREREREQDAALASEWARDPLSRALFAVASDPAHEKSKPLLMAIARAYHVVATRAGNYPTAPSEEALKFLGLSRYEKIPFEES